MAGAPGDVIAGKYQLEQVLGEGGMGVVWRARNLALDLPVAIKVMSNVATDRRVLRERLLLEAKAAARVAHPAIVKVFDVARTERDEPFIVMELLAGTSLGAILAREGRISPTQAVSVLLPIAEALRAAHEHGIVHRDVKPDNILIAEEEGSRQPKLLDFGIVKLRRDGLGHITDAGLVVGSPDYMSPEQARGQEDVDHRSDVWAFSVSLFEAVSGRPPFSGNNYNALLRQILEDAPPSLHELGLVDEELSQIVARGLSKRPEQRGTMGEMGEALAAWLLKQGVTADICGTVIAGRWLHEAGGAPAPRTAGKTLVPDASSGFRSGVRSWRIWLGLVAVLALGLAGRALHQNGAGTPRGEPAKNRLHASAAKPAPTPEARDHDISSAPIVGVEELPREEELPRKKDSESAQKPKAPPRIVSRRPHISLPSQASSGAQPQASSGAAEAPSANPPAPATPAQSEPQELMDPY